MTVGMAALAGVSLGGDAIVTIEAFKTAAPYVVPPLKLAVSFPIIYHYMAGVRHLVWDTYHIGNQTEKSLWTRSRWRSLPTLCSLPRSWQADSSQLSENN